MRGPNSTLGRPITTILTVHILNVKFDKENGYDKSFTVSNISKGQNFKKRLWNCGSTKMQIQLHKNFDCIK